MTVWWWILLKPCWIWTIDHRYDSHKSTVDSEQGQTLFCQRILRWRVTQHNWSTTIPKACGFEAATLRVAGVSPARHAGILPAVGGSLIPIVVIGMGMVLPG
jgi:hypothetical protein